MIPELWTEARHSISKGPERGVIKAAIMEVCWFEHEVKM